MSEVLIRYLTIITLLFGILGILWGFGRRLFKYLQPLSELPEIKRLLRTLEETGNAHHEENKQWQREHLDREHPPGRQRR